VIVFEHHHSAQAAKTRRLLYREAIKHNIALATEYLTKDPSSVELARIFHFNGFGGIPERDGKPAFTAPDIQGLDHELVRGIWTMAILSDNVWALRTDRGNKMIDEYQTHSAQKELLEDLIHNPALQKTLAEIWTGNDNNQISSRLSDKTIRDFWQDERQDNYQLRVRQMAAGFLLMAGKTSSSPNGWRWDFGTLLSEGGPQAQQLLQGKGQDDLTFYLLVKTTVELMKAKFPFSRSEDAIGLLSRDWVFSANAANVVCNASERKRKTVVLNVGAAHAERTARYLAAKFGDEKLKIRYINGDDSSFRVERLYNKADQGDLPADYFNPSNECRSSAPTHLKRVVPTHNIPIAQ
jgi:hypothetical protein